MKKIALIFLMFILGVGFSYSQSSVLEKKISIKIKNKTVVEVFEQISKQTNYFFTYNPKYIPQKKTYTKQFKNTSVRKILKHIIPDSTLSYKIIEDHIVICKKQKSELFFSSPINSNQEIIEISGKITNAETNKALPFASIGILNSAIGTVANENGEYTFKIDKTYKDSTLFISQLGYKTHFLSISNTNTNNNNFQLIEKFVPIQEVIIRTIDPIFLLKKALKNIKENYSQKTNILTAFYREGVERKENLLSFSEAVIKIFKTPYKASLISDKIKVEKSRKFINTEEADTVFLKLKDGLYSGLELDFIKNPIDFLLEDDFSNYRYRISDIVVFGDKLAYVIDFNQKENVVNSLYKGRIFIESETFAIVYAEFELNISETTKKPDFVAKKNRKLSVTPISAKYKISYRSTGKKYMLNHVRADLEFKIKRKRKLFTSHYKTFFETVIFDVDSINPEKFNKKETAKRNMVFIDNNYKYDSKFWGSENYISPEKSIKDVLKQIKVKLKVNLK